MMVNTLILKVFCVLFCRGTHKEKSMILFDAIIGPTGIKVERDQISWKSSRMLRAFKYLIYFSEVFPKKYWSELMESDKSDPERAQSPNKRLFGSFTESEDTRGQLLSRVTQDQMEDIKVKIEERKEENADDANTEKKEKKKEGDNDDPNREFLWSNEYIHYLD
jgi:hypothetical protein